MIGIHQVALQGNIASRKKDGVQKQNHADTNIKRKKDMEAIDKYVILGNSSQDVHIQLFAKDKFNEQLCKLNISITHFQK